MTASMIYLPYCYWPNEFPALFPSLRAPCPVPAVTVVPLSMSDHDSSQLCSYPGTVPWSNWWLLAGLLLLGPALYLLVGLDLLVTALNRGALGRPYSGLLVSSAPTMGYLPTPRVPRRFWLLRPGNSRQGPSLLTDQLGRALPLTLRDCVRLLFEDDWVKIILLGVYIRVSAYYFPLSSPPPCIWSAHNSPPYPSTFSFPPPFL